MEKLSMAMNAPKWRICLIDDHPVTLLGLGALIERESDMTVCGEARGVSEGLQVVSKNEPDLVVVDMALPDGGGLDLVRRLKARFPDTKLLVCSMYDELLYAGRVLRAGANGYISKDQAATRIVDAIRRVLGGAIYLSDEMTQHMLQGKPGRRPLTVEDLTDRELEVFFLIGKGLKTSQIAQRLHLSVKTVETHREKIKHKLNLTSSCALTRHAATWSVENDNAV